MHAQNAYTRKLSQRSTMLILYHSNTTSCASSPQAKWHPKLSKLYLNTHENTHDRIKKQYLSFPVSLVILWWLLFFSSPLIFARDDASAQRLRSDLEFSEASQTFLPLSLVWRLAGKFQELDATATSATCSTCYTTEFKHSNAIVAYGTLYPAV